MSRARAVCAREAIGEHIDPHQFKCITQFNTGRTLPMNRTETLPSPVHRVSPSLCSATTVRGHAQMFLTAHLFSLKTTCLYNS